jgi:uncharacterized membrane protein
MKPEPNKTNAEIAFEDLIQSNIETIARIEQAGHNSRTKGDVFSDAITNFCGSTIFVLWQCILIAGWVTWNSIPATKSSHFDASPFNMLSLVVSFEAILLATFILISQNSQKRKAEQRNHLDLQINLLAEQETSQLLIMMRQVMEKLEIENRTPEATALENSTDPELLIEHISDKIALDTKSQSASNDLSTDA